MNALTTHRKIAVGTLAVIGATTLGGVAVQPAQASSDTWKKVAIGAGVVTGYGLLKGNNKVAIIGGLATAGSYYKYKQDKKKEQERDWRYNRRYNRNWR